MRRRGRWLGGHLGSSATILLALAVLPAAGLAADTPEGVSPGSATAALRLSTSCPTFSWSGLARADGYELVLYRVGEDDSLDRVMQTRVPGGARAWTPSAAECPAPGSRYAWAVRADNGQAAGAASGAWSDPLLFETPASPTEEEVRRSLETLRRHLRGTRSPSPTAGESRSPSAGLEQPDQALRSATVGSGPTAAAITAPDAFSLSLDGDLDLGGNIFQGNIALLHTNSVDLGLGWHALASLTTGSRNTGLGREALLSTTEGSFNTASGYQALRDNTTGSKNTASSYAALLSNTTGDFNTAVGTRALESNTSGGGNTAVGYRALQYNTGGLNTAIGFDAGRLWTSGMNNIAIGRGAVGFAQESHVIRIGGGDLQTQTFIEGIHGANVGSASQVFINSNNKLGTSTSSLRFKEDVRDLEGSDERLLELRPVSFRYKEEIAGSGPKPIEYGLIAEEVAVVFPELVAHDEEGRPHTVRYHLLTPLLLAEIQRQERELEQLRRSMAKLRGRQRSPPDSTTTEKGEESHGIHLETEARDERLHARIPPRGARGEGGGRGGGPERTCLDRTGWWRSPLGVR